MSTKANYNNKIDDCSLTYAMSLIGGKWRLPVIWAIHQKSGIRYTELRKAVTGITNMMLSQILKDLEAQKLIVRVQFSEVPLRVEYTLTDQGERLIPALKALASWGREMKAY